MNQTAERTMEQTSTPFTPIFLRHDLMIEMGRLEALMETARADENAKHLVQSMEERVGRIAEALRKLPH